VKILIRSTLEGPAVVPVDGLPCGVPGLAITRTPHAGDGYVITHVRSGNGVLWFPDTDPEGVLAAAQELAPLADWTISGAALTAIRGLGSRTWAVGSRYDAERIQADRTELGDITPP
jgi:hypothetical protein